MKTLFWIAVAVVAFFALAAGIQYLLPGFAAISASAAIIGTIYALYALR